MYLNNVVLGRSVLWNTSILTRRLTQIETGFRPRARLVALNAVQDSATAHPSTCATWRYSLSLLSPRRFSPQCHCVGSMEERNFWYQVSNPHVSASPPLHTTYTNTFALTSPSSVPLSSNPQVPSHASFDASFAAFHFAPLSLVVAPAAFPLVAPTPCLSGVPLRAPLPLSSCSLASYFRFFPAFPRVSFALLTLSSRFPRLSSPVSYILPLPNLFLLSLVPKSVFHSNSLSPVLTTSNITQLNTLTQHKIRKGIRIRTSPAA